MNNNEKSQGVKRKRNMYDAVADVFGAILVVKGLQDVERKCQ